MRNTTLFNKLFDPEERQQSVDTTPNLSSSLSSSSELIATSASEVAYEHSPENYARAIEAFTVSITQQTHNPEAYYVMGKAHYKANNYQLAMETFNTSILQEEHNPQAYRGLGLVYLSTKNYQKAIEAFTQSIAQQALNPKAYSGLGLVYLSTKNYQKAIEAFTQSIEQQAHNPYAYYGLAKAHLMAGNHKRAIETFTTSIEQQPHNPHAYQELAIAYLSTENHQRAIESFTISIEQQAHNPHAYLGRSIAYLLVGDRLAAQVDFFRGQSQYITRELHPLNSTTFTCPPLRTQESPFPTLTSSSLITVPLQEHSDVKGVPLGVNGAAIALPAPYSGIRRRREEDTANEELGEGGKRSCAR